MHSLVARIATLLTAAFIAATAANAQSASGPPASAISRQPAATVALTPSTPTTRDPAGSKSTWEAKDTVLAVGLAVTLFLGVMNAFANFRMSRRTTFINTVTSQRIKWIEQLRQDVSSYAGLTFHWVSTDLRDEVKRQELLQEIDRLQHVIRLRLNPSGEEDRKIAHYLAEIPNHTDRPEVISALLEDLTAATQRLLKEEWDKVKKESQHGPLSTRA